MIRLVFRGELLPGKEPDRVIAALARLLGQPEAIIRQHLFSDWPVTVKTVATRQEARRYVLAFARSGAVLHAVPLNTAYAPVSGPTPGRGRHRSLAIVLAAVGISLAAMLAWAAWYTAPLWYVGQEDRGLEAAALFGESDLIAAVYLDLARSRTLAHRFGPESWQAPAWTEGLQSLISQMESFGIDPLSDIDHLWLSLHGLDNGYRWALQLEGRFEAAAFRQWLAARHQVERIDAETGITYFRWRGRRLCQPETLKAAHVVDDHIFITDSEHLPKLLQRLKAGPQADSAAQWDLRTGHIAAAVVTRPERLTAFASAETRDFWARIRAGLGRTSMLYADVKPTLLPAALDLKATLLGEPADITALRQTLQTLGHPESASPLSAARVAGTDGGLSFRLPLTAADSAENSLWSLLSVLHGLPPAGRPEGSEYNPIPAIPAPLAGVERGMLAEFDASSDPAAFKPQWTRGPFALRVGELAAVDGRLRMTLEALSQALPAAIREGTLPRLSVIDVFNDQGDSVLDRGYCGPDLNRRPALFTRRGSQLSVSKPLTLRPGSRLERIAAIRGTIELALPIRLHTEVLEKAQGGILTDTQGVTIRLRWQTQDTLAYHLGGEYQRVVAVRARDDDGRLMDGIQTKRVTLPYSLGYEVIERFPAPVRDVEVVLATELEPMRYPFTLTGAYPPASAPPMAPSALPRPVAERQWRRALQTSPPSMAEIGVRPHHHGVTGPLALMITEHAARSEKEPPRAVIEAYAPPDFPLPRHLGGLQLELRRALRASGEWASIEVNAPLTLMPSSLMSNLHDAPVLRATWPLVADSLSLDHSRSYTGNVTVNLPIEMATRRLSPVPGSRWRGRHLDVAVQRWSAQGLTLTIDGNVGRLVAATALDANGERADGEVRLIPSDDHAALLTIALHAVPQSVILTYAASLRHQTFPITLQWQETNTSLPSSQSAVDDIPRPTATNAAQP